LKERCLNFTQLGESCTKTLDCCPCIVDADDRGDVCTNWLKSKETLLGMFDLENLKKVKVLLPKEMFWGVNWKTKTNESLTNLRLRQTP